MVCPLFAAILSSANSGFGENLLHAPLCVNHDCAQVVANPSRLLPIGLPKLKPKLLRDGGNVDQFARGETPVFWISLEPLGVGFQDCRRV